MSELTTDRVWHKRDGKLVPLVPEAKVERLREALRQILHYSDTGESWLAISQIAREALASDITAHPPNA